MTELVDALHRGTVLQQNLPSKLLATFTCNPCKKECLKRYCETCKLKSVCFTDISDFYFIVQYEWKNIKEKRISIKTEKVIEVQRIVKHKVDTTVGKLKKLLLDTLEVFLSHVYRVEPQQSTMSNLKSSLKKVDLFFHMGLVRISKVSMLKSHNLYILVLQEKQLPFILIFDIPSANTAAKQCSLR